ncbi:hypothetical protein LuPra_05166 [Luteitalea pratensis]|uniref:Uncharacterized protein n=1 Tax=Luteitalea pratensis TaxID=1855912 RepID=A0A143PUN4_LUTPR|nr:hypothetical protein LuPra_05166 [Luteitalea pratensis]
MDERSTSMSAVCNARQTALGNWSTMDRMESSLGRPSLSGIKRDARWQRWLAKGYAHEAGVRYRVRLVTLSIGALIALALAVALTIR